jgi:hypothetical protein
MYSFLFKRRTSHITCLPFIFNLLQNFTRQYKEKGRRKWRPFARKEWYLGGVESSDWTVPNNDADDDNYHQRDQTPSLSKKMIRKVNIRSGGEDT